MTRNSVEISFMLYCSFQLASGIMIDEGLPHCLGLVLAWNAAGCSIKWTWTWIKLLQKWCAFVPNQFLHHIASLQPNNLLRCIIDSLFWIVQLYREASTSDCYCIAAFSFYTLITLICACYRISSDIMWFFRKVNAFKIFILNAAWKMCFMQTKNRSTFALICVHC